MDPVLRFQLQGQRQRVQVIGKNDVNGEARKQLPRLLDRRHTVVGAPVAAAQQPEPVRGPANRVGRQGKMFIHAFRGCPVAARDEVIFAAEETHLLEHARVRPDRRERNDEKSGQGSHASIIPDRGSHSLRGGRRRAETGLRAIAAKRCSAGTGYGRPGQRRQSLRPGWPRSWRKPPGSTCR